MGQHYQSILKLLSDGKVAEAELEAERLMELISSLEGDYELIGQMIQRAKNDSPKQPQKSALTLKPKLKQVSKKDRSIFIRKFAFDMAGANGGKVASSDVAEAITKAGFSLGTDVPGTVVGNVLYKDSSNWSRVEKGLFRYVGLPQ